jgi:hypothetical protein
MSMYPRYKTKEIKDNEEIKEYYRRCQYISILQIMGMINDKLGEYKGSIGVIKIGPSKEGKKNCCIIDDSSILDEKTNEIRDTIGNEEEPHRGHRLIYQLRLEERNNIIKGLEEMIIPLHNILNQINRNEYMLYDPIYMLQRVVYYSGKNNKKNIINYLSWEIHDSPHLLSYEEKLNMFRDYEGLYKLWYNNYITDNQGKIRIFILCLHYINLVRSQKIIENF